MLRAASPTNSHCSSMETISLMRTAVSPTASARPLTPRSALAATYATYVVRVHTRHGIKTISFDLLAAFFTYTAKKAAEDLGISSRTLIRVCRSLGIRRWPYLGFRSEKNVERIRQEAIENLRRKLEREGAETATSVTSPNTSCLRGASAKRLLQVKLPQVAGAVAPMPKSHLPSPAAYFQQTHHHHMTHNMHNLLHNQQNQSQVHNYSQHQHQVHHHSHNQGMPLLTPPPTHQAFNLDREPTLSPRRVHMPVHNLHQYRHQPPSAASSVASSPSSSISSASSPSSSHMPSLNVLMEASILTAFKHEMTRPTESARVAEDATDANNARTMSMRDILSHTALAA